MRAASLRTARSVLLAGVLGLAAACGGGSRDLPDPGPTSGLDQSAPLVGLDTARETTLCEWIGGRIGGYGHRATCSNGDYISALPVQQCVAGYQMLDPSCAATVGDVESCINDAVDGCSSFPVGCVPLVFCAQPTGALMRLSTAAAP